jgi:phosphatidylinositol alpha-1,6-mannosyltransferase
MQTLAAGIWRSLERRAAGARIIAHGGSNRALPGWLLGALPRTGWAMATRATDSVLTGDALMYALCRPLLVAGGLPHATMIMGLDVTYQNRIYRAIVHPALRRSPRVIAISRATAAAAEEIGVRPDRISVVRLGVEAPPADAGSRRAAAAAIRADLGIPPDQSVLLTLGRLVRRKGIDWFIRRVMPQLPDRAVYVIAGEGPLAAELERVVVELGLAGRVRMLGQVDDARREQLLSGADLFVQPNVSVPGDMEGFGLVVLEAAMRGTVTVASAIEGILDAVVDGETGILVPAADHVAWIERLTGLVTAPDQLPTLGRRFREAAQRLYSEEQMGDRLLELLGPSTQ